MNIIYKYCLLFSLFSVTFGCYGQDKVGNKPRWWPALHSCFELALEREHHDLKELLGEAHHRGMQIRLHIKSNFFEVDGYDVPRGNSNDELIINFDCYAQSDTIDSKDNCTGVLWHSGLTPQIQTQ